MSPLSDDTTREICSWLDLGLPLGTASPVPGGLLHHMWRLETTTGVWAVKDLNPEIIRRPGIADVYRESERIARHVAAAGLPAIPALQRMGDPLLTLSDRSVLVFAWIEGTALPESAVMPSDAKRIGRLLGQIHSLGIETHGLEASDGLAPDHSSWRVNRPGFPGDLIP